MERALATKNKLEMVDGSMPQPPINSPNFKARKKCNTWCLVGLHIMFLKTFLLAFFTSPRPKMLGKI